MQYVEYVRNNGAQINDSLVEYIKKCLNEHNDGVSVDIKHPVGFGVKVKQMPVFKDRYNTAFLDVK